MVSPRSRRPVSNGQRRKRTWSMAIFILQVFPTIAATTSVPSKSTGASPPSRTASTTITVEQQWDIRPPEWLGFRGGSSDSSSIDDANDITDSLIDNREDDDNKNRQDLDDQKERGDETAAVSSTGEEEPSSFDGTQTPQRSEDDAPRPPENTSTRQEAPSMRVPRVRPNRLYRILLNYGFWGHVVILESVVAVEWLHLYVPAIPNLAAYVMYDILKFRRASDMRGNGESPVSRTSGFLSADGTAARGGRKRKSQTRKDDQRALNQLRKLGDVNQARFRYLSQAFMQRHGLGPYARSAPRNFQSQYGGLAPDFVLPTASSRTDDEEEAESDSEWIVQALTGKEDDYEDEIEAVSPFDTNVGVSLGSSGPSVRVGVGFTLGSGGTRKKRSKRKVQKLPSVSFSSEAASSISAAARQTSSSLQMRQSSGPRLSDSEGGVMGRLRAASANSLMGRNLLGAYPGDLPPPQEAADALGLTDLARRYGYGSWREDNDAISDDDDDVDLWEEKRPFDEEEDDDDDNKMLSSRIKSSTKRKKKRSSPSKKKKRRTTSRTRQPPQNSIGVEFSVGSTSKSDSLPPSTSSAVPSLAKITSPYTKRMPKSSKAAGTTKTTKRRKRVAPLTPMKALGELGDLDPSSTKRGAPKATTLHKTKGAVKSEAESSPTPTTTTTSKSILLDKNRKTVAPALSVLKKAQHPPTTAKRSSSTAASALASSTGETQDTPTGQK